MRHLLAIGELAKQEIEQIIASSIDLQHSRTKPLDGKSILFSFEKPSLRTVVATEAAITQLGGSVINIKPENFFGGNVLFADGGMLQNNVRESLKDTVNNVSQWCDAIFARVFSHDTLTEIASHSAIPVINALSDCHHPMQAIADLYTIQEVFGEHAISVAFVGDANNVAYSLIEILLLFGHDVRFAGPDTYSFSSVQIRHFQDIASRFHGKITFTDDPCKAVGGADIVYTDTFISMGEEGIHDEKITLFSGYQVNQRLLSMTQKQSFFMHCLPAHRGVEVTDDVIDSDISLVYRQAKNRMVTAKGVFAVVLQ